MKKLIAIVAATASAIGASIGLNKHRAKRGQQESSEPPAPPEARNQYAQWLKLDGLRQRKIITEAEYQEQRRALLEELE
jgi:hypothetical protein